MTQPRCTQCGHAVTHQRYLERLTWIAMLFYVGVLGLAVLGGIVWISVSSLDPDIGFSGLFRLWGFIFTALVVTTGLLFLYWRDFYVCTACGHAWRQPRTHPAPDPSPTE